jgi:DNA-binding response OmpR family regulator
MPRSKILVVDDEPDLVLLLKGWLQEEGYEVYTATDAQHGLQLFFQHHPVLTITDLLMPGMDGFQLISRFREMSDAHVLVLTALEGEENLIRGLGLGADGYLVKPVSKRVFLARVRAILRRAQPLQEVYSSYSDTSVELDLLAHEASVRGRAVHLSPTEFRLLAYLCQNRDRVVGHRELLDRVWARWVGRWTA